MAAKRPVRRTHLFDGIAPLELAILAIALTLGKVLPVAGYFKVIKEVTRHILRRPVVGIAAAAQTKDGQWLLIRRGDTGQWALPGGTLEWGETLRTAIVRELEEEAGVVNVTLGDILGVYSAPNRDQRFHAVSIVVGAIIEAPCRAPLNPVEILEVRLFRDSELPTTLAHGMSDMLNRARQGERYWE
jgi:8-oxo-dGTP diphosphatase